MKNHLFYSLLFALVLGVSSCRTDLDWANMDPTVKVDLGLAMPVGEISVAIGDFLGNSQINLGVREDGTYFLHDSANIEMQNFDIPVPDIKSQLPAIQQEIALLDQLNIGTFDYHANFIYQTSHGPIAVDRVLPVQFNSNLELRVEFDTTVVVMGNSYQTHIDTTLALDEVPVAVSALPTREVSTSFKMNLSAINNSQTCRIDSVMLSGVSFTTKFNLTNIGMPFEQIEYITVSLDPKAFHRTAGNVISLPLDGTGFGQNIPMNLGDFTLNLMKDPAAAPSATNQLTEASLSIKMVLNCEQGDTLYIRKNPKVSFSIEATDMQWEAVFGQFKLDEPMAFTDTFNIGESIFGVEMLKEAILPLAEPRMELHTHWQLGVPVALHFNSLTMHDLTHNQTAYAEWNGQQSYTWNMTNMPHGGIDAYADNVLVLSSDPDKGHLDKLFTVRPELIRFDISADINQQVSEQHRVIRQPKMETYFVYDIPFSLNAGMNIQLSDTVRDLEISSLSLDSLLGEVEVIDSVRAKVKLVVTTENMIPFNILAQITFLNDKDQEVKINCDGLKDIRLNKPSGYDPQTHLFVNPGVSNIVIELEDKELEKLSDVKGMIYSLSLNDTDAANQEAASYPLLITQKDKVKIKLALAADASAYLNVSLNGKEN